MSGERVGHWGSWCIAMLNIYCSFEWPYSAAHPPVTLADLVEKVAKLEAQQALVDADLLPILQRGLFTVLDVEDHPICCGFFVTKSGIAFTVRHDHSLWLRSGNIVHAVMLKSSEPTQDARVMVEPSFSVSARTDSGSITAVVARSESTAAATATSCSAPESILVAVGAAAEASIPVSAAAPHETLLQFRLHSFSPEADLDYTCMILISPVAVGTFEPLSIPTHTLPDELLIGARATLLHGGIALNRLFHLDPSASLMSCSIITAHSKRVLYNAATAGGDSGGALILSGKVLIAMHVEGLNDIPADLEVLSPNEGTRKAPKKIKLSQASPSTVGAALRLDLPEIRAAIRAAESDIARH